MSIHYSTPVYPANYGSTPGIRAGDGDPLDALMLARAPLHPGVLVRFRLIGVLRMLDGAGANPVRVQGFATPPKPATSSADR